MPKIPAIFHLPLAALIGAILTYFGLPAPECPVCEVCPEVVPEAVPAESPAPEATPSAPPSDAPPEPE